MVQLLVIQLQCSNFLKSFYNNIEECLKEKHFFIIILNMEWIKCSLLNANLM